MEDPKAPLIPLEPPPEGKPELTFGIEIEFVVATAPVNEIDPQPELWGQIFEMHDRRHYTNERLVGAHICKTLNKYGIPAELHNGMAFSADGSTLFLSHSNTRQIFKFDYEGAAGG